MAVTPPDWLTRHDGSRQGSPAGHAWQVYLDGAPLVRLVPPPAAGRFSCAVTQTENGKRIDKGATFPTADDALRGGLEDLRTYLGW